jgi:26S proteasome regulatory subunit N4
VRLSQLNVSDLRLPHQAMGMTLPDPDSPREIARALIARKEAIEAEMEAHMSVLKANSMTLNSPLVDNEGFPLSNVDIYAVRGARVRIIELRNDLKTVTDDIAKALEKVYDPSVMAAASNALSESEAHPEVPIARVDGVSPSSPASEAVRYSQFSSY